MGPYAPKNNIAVVCIKLWEFFEYAHAGVFQSLRRQIFPTRKKIARSAEDSQYSYANICMICLRPNLFG